MTTLEKRTLASRGQQAQLYIVRFNDGSKPFVGTMSEIMQRNPAWRAYARLYNPPAQRQQPAAPHHAGTYAGTHPEDQPFQSDQFEQEDEDPWYGFDGGLEGGGNIAPKSVRKWQSTQTPASQANYQYKVMPGKVTNPSAIPPRLSRQQAPATNAPTYKQQPAATEDYDDEPKPVKKKRPWFLNMHPLMYLGLGMFAMLGLWVSGNALLLKWQTIQYDWTYTATFRTYSTDAVVGHNHDSEANPSHFIAQNDKGHIIIIELPANDIHAALIYAGPSIMGTDAKTTPVTITFQRNPTTGRVDMYLHVGNVTYTYTNNGSKFIQPQS